MHSRRMSTNKINSDKLAASPGCVTAIRAEAHKLLRSLVGIIASSALIVGTLALLAGITAGVASGNEELIAQAGPAANLNWDGLLLGAGQITAAGGLIGFGVVLAWLKIGRASCRERVNCKWHGISSKRGIKFN